MRDDGRMYIKYHNARINNRNTIHAKIYEKDIVKLLCQKHLRYRTEDQNRKYNTENEVK